MKNEQTALKLQRIRKLRILMGLNDSRMSWEFGSNWKRFDLTGLNRLDSYVQKVINRLHAAFGKEANREIELLEDLMTEIMESEVRANDELARLLKEPQLSRKVKKLLSDKGFSQRDVNRAARDLDVNRDMKKSSTGRMQMWWSLPDEN